MNAVVAPASSEGRWRGRLREAWPSAAALAGWALVTLGLASLFGPVSWAFSAGLLLLSLVGWRPLLYIFREGLPALAVREGPEAPAAEHQPPLRRKTS